MIDFSQIEAMHEQVREFVEQQEPEYKVTSIDCYITTNYIPTLHSQYEISPAHAKFKLVQIKAHFRIEARYLANTARRLSCQVIALSDGRLSFSDHTVKR